LDDPSVDGTAIEIVHNGDEMQRANAPV